MDPSVDLLMYRSLLSKAHDPVSCPSDIVDIALRGATHVWSQVRDEVTKNLLPALPHNTQSEIIASLLQRLRLASSTTTWQVRTGILEAFRSLRTYLQQCPTDAAFVADFASQDSVLGDPTPNVRQSALRLLGSLPGGVDIDRVLRGLRDRKDTFDVNLTESYVSLLLGAAPEERFPRCDEISHVLLGYLDHRASSIRQCVSEVYGSLVTSIASAQRVLDLLCSIVTVPSAASWQHTEGLCMILESVITTVLTKHTPLRPSHVDPYFMDTPAFCIPDVLIKKCVMECCASTQFELLRMAKLLQPLVVHVGLLWAPDALCALSFEAPIEFRREVLWGYILLSEPSSSRYAPRLRHCRLNILRSCYNPSDTIMALISTAYLGYPLPTLTSFDVLPLEWVPILPDVASSPALKEPERLRLVEYCIERLLAPRVPLYTAMTLLESLVQALCLIPQRNPRFLAFCPNDFMYTPPRTSDNAWCVVPNPDAHRYPSHHPVLSHPHVPYTVMPLGLRCFVPSLHRLSSVVAHKGLELPVFKMLLFVGAYAVMSTPEDLINKARGLWVDGVSRRLETETRGGGEKKKSTNSFDDSTDEEEEEQASRSTNNTIWSKDSSLSLGTSHLVYDYNTLEALYIDFIDFLWDERKEK